VLDFGAIAIDTNVVIYAFDASESAAAKRGVARAILERAGRFPLRLPLQVAAESFRVLTHRLGWAKRDAKEVLTALLTDIPHLGATRDSTVTAFELCADHKVSFWDALLLAAASAAGCGVMLSEDFQDRRRFDPPHVARTIWILNPFLEENREALETLGVLPT
jgi:predicted nucleic acid-binding protein